MMHNWGYGYGTGWLHMIGMAIFWIIIIALAIYLIKGLTTNNNYSNKQLNKTKSEDAIEIAKKRYARGEISKEEYQKLLNDLKND
ncbi:SHOCT domain-containing protein [Natroniella sulfidigena]|uniref:SHOCT domain-containing protein n=1 Tax=Natroniella sulfidigena TaxID=723921 RepID=UPI00200A1D1E|nr:SHOCT domain-containing protein [Natroniella sulfidigena]MCK8816833.1 SHOCT domain-containing protein [Natroniella sulfidigena]